MKYDKIVVDALTSGAGADEVRTWLDTGEGDPASWNPLLAGSAIEAAVQLKNVALLQSLERAPKALKKAARRGLHKLKSQGVTVESAAPKAFALSREEINVPPVAFVGPPDVEGYSEFFLGFTDAEGTCCTMGRFGGNEGFRSLSHGHISRGALRKMKGEMKAILTEVPFTEALHHILPSVDIFAALRGQVPHDWEHFVTHLPEEMMAEAALNPLPDADSADVGGSSMLPADIWFSMWPVSDDAITQVVSAFAARAESGEDADLAPLMDDAAEVALSPDVRTEWVRRTRLAASAARARGEEHLLNSALRLEQALTTGTSARDIPLVTAMLQANVAMLAAQAQAPE